MAESPVPSPYTKTDWLISILLFVCLSSLYFATTSGITSSNDGSHYALTRTIVQNHTFALQQFDDYAEGNDIAIRDDILYSDRPPGTALLATLFYRLGSPLAPLLSPLASPLPSRHDAENPHLLYVMLLPIWAGAGTAVLLYLLLRYVGTKSEVAVTAVLFFSLGTIHWKYSTVLFSHALSGFLVVLSLFLLITFPPPRRFSLSFLLGFVLGCAVLVEYSNALLVIIVGLYVLVERRPFRHSLLPFSLGGLGPALFLAYYNHLNFGSPLTLSYAYAINYPWASQFSTTFSYPLLAGLRALAFFGTGDGWCGGPPCPNQGFLLLSPVLLLAIPGFYFYAQQSKKAFVLTTAVFLTYLLLFATHRTVHGFTADGRYLAPFLTLLTLPLASTLTWLQKQTHHPHRHSLLTLLTYGLFFLSAHNILLHIGFSYNYHLDLTQFSPLVTAPQNWRIIYDTLFRNTHNLPLLWLLEASLLLLTIGIRHLLTHRRPPPA